jgi:hypothetical protein
LARTAKKLSEMGVVEGVEELLDVDLQDPPARHAHRFVLQGLEA